MPTPRHERGPELVEWANGSSTSVQVFTSSVYHVANEKDNPARQTRYSRKKKLLVPRIGG